MGANLARRLVRDGYEVHVLLRPGHADWRLQAIADDIVAHAVALADSVGVRRVLGEVGPRCVFHLAVHGAYPTQRDSRAIIETNVAATVSLIDACLDAGVETIVNTGSSSEYGFKDHAAHEDELIEPNSLYAVTKAAATLYCRFRARDLNRRIPTLRLYSVYGPYEEPTRLIPTLIVNGLSGRFPPLASPATARDFVHVDDVVDSYLRVVSAPLPDPGAIYNVGTGVQASLRQVVEEMGRQLKISDRPRWGSLAARAWDTTVWRADISRTQADLGWQPRYTLSAGLGNTIEWFRSNQGMLARYRRVLEMDEQRAA